MKPEPSAPPPGKRAALVLAVAVHLLLALFLFYGVHWQSQSSSAVAVELVRSIPAPQVRSQPAPPPEPKVEPEVEPKPEPQVETKPPPSPPKPEIVQKEKPAKKPVEKPKPTEKPKPLEKPKPPNKPAEKPKPHTDPFQQQLQKDLRATEQRKASEAAAKELAQLQAAQAAASLSKAQQAWQDKIAAKIKGNIVRPVGVSGDPEAVFEVTLLPDGSLVGEPVLKKSTGIPALDDAIERAIKKSDPLPKPADPSVFERRLVLTFRPLEDQ